MKLIKQILYLAIFLSAILAGAIKTKTIKTYTISRNFGTETRELTHSTFVRYNHKRRVLDSMRTENVVVGYTDCGCNEDFVPGVVLDPFIGS